MAKIDVTFVLYLLKDNYVVYKITYTDDSVLENKIKNIQHTSTIERVLEFETNPANIGDYWNNNEFINKPFPSWKLNEETKKFHPPVEMPTTGIQVWNELKLKWEEIFENEEE